MLQKILNFLWTKNNFNITHFNLLHQKRIIIKKTIIISTQQQNYKPCETSLPVFRVPKKETRIVSCLKCFSASGTNSTVSCQNRNRSSLPNRPLDSECFYENLEPCHCPTRIVGHLDTQQLIFQLFAQKKNNNLFLVS